VINNQSWVETLRLRLQKRRILAKLVFTVTNALNNDQRMIRICSSLASDGHHVTLIGRSDSSSPPLTERPFFQKRLRCFFSNGFLFYAEFNIRLFFYLLFSKADLICAIDLDTILPCLWISKWKGIPRVFDAHELFCEMKEVVERPRIYRVWKKIENYALPKFEFGYTVNQHLADEFKNMYALDYAVIRSISKGYASIQQQPKEKNIIYQGAVNEGRCFESLIPAMKTVHAELHIFGTGNFISQAKQLVLDHQVSDKVKFWGSVSPEELKKLTPHYYIGITLFEAGAKSNYYSLANRFFDYIHAGVPQLTSDFPVYREMNKQHEIALLLGDSSPNGISSHLNLLLEDDKLWERLHNNCPKAAEEWNWDNESKSLTQFYRNVLS
jgi:glycosyltransferase involved in cell wall biosynthesis